MRRFSIALLLTFCTLVLAVPAQADRGDRWRAWREQHQGDNRGNSDRERDSERRPRFRDGPFDDSYKPRDRDVDRRPWFERRRAHDRAREGVDRGRMISLEELENRIARRAPGYRIGNPELLNYGGRPVYRIRWRTPEGRILIVFADAETGEILEIRGRRRN